jgi:hypothetical protein
MPFDGEEHARTQHEKLECKGDDGEPIDHGEYFQVMCGMRMREAGRQATAILGWYCRIF